MDTLELARLQFGITAVYHFLMVSLTIGLSLVVAWYQTRWHRSGDVRYLRLTRFFGKLFVVNFAMGVVTGIVQEFQFGMAWSNYSRFVGDVFYTYPNEMLALDPSLLSWSKEADQCDGSAFNAKQKTRDGSLTAVDYVFLTTPVSCSGDAILQPTNLGITSPPHPRVLTAKNPEGRDRDELLGLQHSVLECLASRNCGRAAHMPVAREIHPKACEACTIPTAVLVSRHLMGEGAVDDLACREFSDSTANSGCLPVSCRAIVDRLSTL